VAVRASGSAREAAPGEHGFVVDRWAAKRQLYLDNLKVIMIAAIIAGHGVVGSFALAWLLISRVPGVARIL
jgi:hypothetical protein